MSQSDFGGDGTVAAFKRVLACIALSITITGFAQSTGVLSQTNAAMSQSSSLRQNSYTNIAHALGKASPLFSAEYEPDIERHRLWLETIQSRMRFVGENDAYVQLSSIHVKDSGNAKIASAILDAAQRLVEETNADFEECENRINSLDVSPAMKRSILDAAVFFAFSNVTDDWSCYSKLVEKHRDILSMADKRESVALNVRMVRLLSEWNPVERGCIADRARCLEKTLFVSKCLDDEVLSISTTLFRCAEIVSAGKKLMTVALNLPDDEIKAYSALKYDEKHILRELDPDGKRRMLAECFDPGMVLSFVKSNCHLPVKDFPFSVAERFAREIGSILGTADQKEEWADFIDTFDHLYSVENDDLSNYWNRKDAREGKSSESNGGATVLDSGRLDTYQTQEALKAEMGHYGLSAGVFVQADSFAPGSTNQLAYLLYKPKSGGKVPLLLFIPGSGEMGFDLSKQFRQRTIFEKVTSAEFQKKHPCYLLVISPPEDCPDLCGYGPNMKPGKFQRPFLSALSAVIQAQKAPAVDMDRIYATGLSMGGRSVYGLSFVAPHLFAACAPVSSGVFSPEDVREERPGNWWHLYNEGDYARHPDSIPRLEAFAARVRELGGDFRIGTYPAEGHNAWDAAWREDALWDWMFSKSLANERPTAVGGVRPAKERKPDRSLAGKVVCTASKAGFDARRGPERAADGLDATAYVSAVPMAAGDWWMCEFKEPVTGRIRVQTGWTDGTKRLSRGHVEVSSDGKLWSRAAGVSQKTGEASFQQRDPIRFVKLLVEPRTPEVLTLRELRLE